MGAPWKLIQQILRDATEDDAFELVADTATVYTTLRTLQRRLREISEEGRVLTESEVAGSRFRYALSGGGRGPEEWLIAIERAIQITESCDTVEEIRGYLTSTRRTAANFSTLTH